MKNKINNQISSFRRIWLFSLKKVIEYYVEDIMKPDMFSCYEMGGDVVLLFDPVQ